MPEPRCILSKFYIKPQQLLKLLKSMIVVSYRNSTSNHNLFGTNVLYNTLYLIEILHQTTTFLSDITNILKLYLIEILHQTTTRVQTKSNQRSCILSKFYIKPQHFCRWFFEQFCCILSKFYIKPQHFRL